MYETNEWGGWATSMAPAGKSRSSGRQILVIRHGGGIRVRAGCFVGTDAEFLQKAASEGKNRYVAILSAVFEGLKKC